MTTRPTFLAALLASIMLLSAAARAQIVPPGCKVSEDVLGVPSPMPGVAKFLQPGSTLNVLAIGSASLFKPEASFAPGSVMSRAVGGATSPIVPPAQVMTDLPTDTAFPQQMVRDLEAAIPGAKVTLSVRGGRGLSAVDQLRLLTEALEHEHFQLILWQTGTVEAVRNLPPNDFAQTLADGAEKAQQAGADLVLIDPQFSRFLQTNSNIEPYEQAFQFVASVPGVVLFRRFDLMRSWVNDGLIDLERTPKPRRMQAVEQLHACLGAQLARFVLSGAKT